MFFHTRFSLPLLIGTLITTPGQAQDFFVDAPDLPEVLTATRLQQAPAEVPGSVSVLDRELIRASGARELSELLRLVPGMLVAANTSLTTINYHGSGANQARRMQVMVDGRSVYRPGFAQVDWSDIPLAIEDIERIEVFRGPNTVSYGANALMAVVNIITRSPRDTHGTRLKTTQGQRGISDWYASQGEGWSDGDLRLSLSGWQDDGFDHDKYDLASRDSRRLNRLNLRVLNELDTTQSLDWQIALKEGSNQGASQYDPTLPIGNQYQRQNIDQDVKARDYAGSLRWNLDLTPQHRLTVRSSAQHWERLSHWGVCDAQLSMSPQLGQLWDQYPAYAQALSKSFMSGQLVLPPGSAQEMALGIQVLQQLVSTYNPATGTLAATCGRIEEDLRENRFDLEVQDTLSLSEQLQVVSGVSYRHDQADSLTYLNGTLQKDILRTFGQVAWYLDTHWLLQGGAMLEDDSSAGTSFSPRLAVNYLITPAHGLRAVYSEAVRSPDMFENYANWQYRVTNLSPPVFGESQARFFKTAVGPGNLDQERMRSHELGYNGRFANLGLSTDIKLFHEELTHLISKRLTLSDFYPDNRNHLNLEGLEGELDWQASRRDRLRLSYAYIETQATYERDEDLTPRHSGTLGWMRDWGNGWSSSAFYLGADSLNNYRFERLDLRLAKRFRIGERQLELAGTWQQRLDDEPLNWSDTFYDERHVYWVSAELEL